MKNVRFSSMGWSLSSCAFEWLILHTDFARAEPLLTPHATLAGTLLLDSLDLVDLAFFLEREFGLEARAEHLREVKTLEGLVAFVQARAA
jgi:acyl carrier protein